MGFPVPIAERDQMMRLVRWLTQPFRDGRRLAQAFEDQIRGASLPPARVDAVLSHIEQTEPTIGRLRQIPIDLIAVSVETFLAETSAPATDRHIQRALRVIASRNALGPTCVQHDSRLA